MIAVDLFAGLGGFTEGARLAGVRTAWASNHWRLAVDVHAANHPETEHVCQDLHQADWTRVPKHDLLLASPACQGHSSARGRERAHHDAQRATACLCRVRHCCNPAHLEQVTTRTNTLRGVGQTAIAHVEGRCTKGHPWTQANSYVRPNGGHSCRVCRRASRAPEPQSQPRNE